MAQKQPGRKVYRTMQGKEIDIDLLRKKNELTPAVGNARVNARGDLLGPGGKIIKTHDEVVKEYYNSKPVKEVKDAPPTAKSTQQTAEDTKDAPRKKTTRAQQKVSEPTSKELEEFKNMDTDWFEDDDGNFVRKGE